MIVRQQGSIEGENDSYTLDQSHINNNEDGIMFAHDTGIAFKDTNDIIRKLQIYDHVTEQSTTTQLG